MASKVTEDESFEIFKLIDDKKKFCTKWWCRKRKTYSLVSIINETYSQNPLSKIACLLHKCSKFMKLKNRVANKKLKIATIHDFLWKIYILIRKN